MLRAALLSPAPQHPSLAVAAHHAAGHLMAPAALCDLALERACPCTACHGSLDDPAHYVIECAGLADLRARNPAVVAAAAAVPAGGGTPPCRRCPSPNILLSCLAPWCCSWAKRRRFAVDGVALMQVAGGGAATYKPAGSDPRWGSALPDAHQHLD